MMIVVIMFETIRRFKLAAFHIVRPHANHDHAHHHHQHHRGGRHDDDDDVGNHLVAGVGRLTHIVGPATFTSGGLVGAKIIL